MRHKKCCCFRCHFKRKNILTRLGSFLFVLSNYVHIHHFISCTGREKSSLCDTPFSICPFVNDYCCCISSYAFLSQRLHYSHSLCYPMVKLFNCYFYRDLVTFGLTRGIGSFHYISQCKSCYRISSKAFCLRCLVIV